jgi:hypothetical protein
LRRKRAVGVIGLEEHADAVRLAFAAALCLGARTRTFSTDGIAQPAHHQ